MTTEPKYDEDVVNLGYLKKIVADPEGNLENIYENVSKHYASKPQPPYHKGDTWIDGNIIYTCINDREIGTYQDSDWTTESGAREEAERKNKVFLRQPSNYSVGDMWILQSDEDHKAGKRGEILISTAGRKEYDEGDWVNMLGYGTIRSINEVADNLNDAIERIGVTEEAIADGIIITFYQNTIPEAKHIGDLWYVTETVDEFIKGKLYRYNGIEWEILNDPEITKAFEEANEARIVADGKIQSFYSDTEPTKNVGVGDLWIDLDDNNKLYRYNGTKWIPVYDTRIDTVVVELETVTERTVKIETDLGKITEEVKEVETTTQTIKTIAEGAQETADNVNTEIIATKERVGSLEIDVDEISNEVSSHTESIQQVQEQTNINTDEIAKLGATETVEGTYLTVDGSNNPAKLYVYGNTEQETRSGKNLLKIIAPTETKNGITFTNNEDGSITINGTSTSSGYIYFNLNITPDDKTYAFDINKEVYSMTAGVILPQKISLTLRTVETNNQYIGISSGQKEKNNITVNTQGKAQAYIAISSGATFDNFTFKPMIVRGSECGEWEEYGAMPSPDYPSDIRNVGDNINILPTNPDAWEQGTLSNGVATANPTRIRTKDFYEVVPKQEYVFSIDIDNYTLVNINIYDKNKTFISYLSTVLGVNDFINKKEIKFTFSENAKYIKTVLRKTNDTINILPSEIKDTKAKLENGCGSVGFKVENKNKFDGLTEIGGFTTTDGSKSSSTTVRRNTNIIKVKPNTNYVLSRNLISFNTRYFYYDINKKYMSTEVKNGTIITPNNCYYINFFSDQILNDYSNIMFEEGTTSKDYVEHQEQTVVFPLSQGQLLHKGDYLAEDGIHQVKGTIIYDGVNTKAGGKHTTIINDVRSFYAFNVTGKKGISGNAESIKCNMFSTGTGGAQSAFNKGECIWDESGTHFYISINKARLDADTTAGMNRYLQSLYDAGIPLIVEYELAEEIVIPYTPEQQKVLDSIETFKNINYIYCIDEIQPEKIILTYYPNTPYNDTLVNKDTFDKVTTEMNAEFNIRANEVETTVREQTTATILTLLNNNYLTGEQVKALVEGNAEDIATVKEQLTQTVTSSQMQIEITKAIEGGVSYLKNTLFTIDENGMWIATSQDAFNALYNNKGMYLYSYEEMIAKFDVDGTTIQGNLTLEGEFITPNLRMMNVDVNGVPHTHIHWIGG